MSVRECSALEILSSSLDWKWLGRRSFSKRRISAEIAILRRHAMPQCRLTQIYYNTALQPAQKNESL
jgi:hypothetical protein